jgi:hypothetical protein
MSLMGRGTRNLARLSFAAKADVPRGSFCWDNRPAAKSFSHSAVNLELRQDNPGKAVRIGTTTASPDEASGATWALSNQDAARRPPPLL